MQETYYEGLRQCQGKNIIGSFVIKINRNIRRHCRTGCCLRVLPCRVRKNTKNDIDNFQIKFIPDVIEIILSEQTQQHIQGTVSHDNAGDNRQCILLYFILKCSKTDL